MIVYYIKDEMGMPIRYAIQYDLFERCAKHVFLTMEELKNEHS
jgi:hypothetical protein